ncbi:MAG TPA: hypothetical protein VM052_02700 [Candidatus Limnocylindrales bacterium]|nr:hypothetical protein [Candidatus Limnocylindrales bacterium]
MRSFISSTVLASLALTAACSDSATAPQSQQGQHPSQVTAPSATILPYKTLVTVRITDIWGSLITDKAPITIGDKAGPQIFDNSAADQNPTVGIISAFATRAPKLNVCLSNDTQHFAIDAMGNYCNEVAGNTSTVDAGSLVMHRFPKVQVLFQDMNGNQLAGAEIQIAANPVTDGFTTWAVDGGAYDYAGLLDGKISIQLNRPGTYSWCEATAPTKPAGFGLPVPKCGTFNAVWDLYTTLVIKHPAKVRVVPI